MAKAKKIEKKEVKKVTKKVEKKPEFRSSEELFEPIMEQVNEFVDNATKYKEKSVVAAAARARKNTSVLTKLFKEYRKATNEEKKK